ncbi:ATP-binding cassette domain-containing protein [Candidatus Electronema sp. JM]|uniref:ATP-binding cassette domain-containing protein n=1 Tax=Candidatus Electronema sp. JM TaxID=3401571 RepID=UPI003AA91019
MLLECKELRFTYPDSSANVLNNLCFALHEPGFNAVFGPSGAGKTSLAKIIAGSIAASEGEITTEGISSILYSCNLERLPGWATLTQHLDAVAPPGKKELRHDLIEVFGLRNLMQAKFSQLSLGQRNRINLLRYLLQDFDLLIMDESLANVDEKLRETIILHIKQCFSDKMFLCISHNLLEVAKFCKEIVVLLDGSGCRVLHGLDCRQHYVLDKSKLDAVMLEIMNAC